MGLHLGRASRKEEGIFGIEVLFEVQRDEPGEPHADGEIPLADVHLGDPGTGLGDAVDFDYPGRRLDDQVEIDLSGGQSPLLFEPGDHLIDVPDLLGRFGFRDHQPVQTGDHDGIQILLLKIPVEAHLYLGAGLVDDGNDVLHELPGGRLVGGGNSVLKVQDDNVRPAGPGLGHEFLPVYRDKEFGPANQCQKTILNTRHENLLKRNDVGSLTLLRGIRFSIFSLISLTGGEAATP